MIGQDPTEVQRQSADRRQREQHRSDDERDAIARARSATLQLLDRALVRLTALLELEPRAAFGLDASALDFGRALHGQHALSFFVSANRVGLGAPPGFFARFSCCAFGLLALALEPRFGFGS